MIQRINYAFQELQAHFTDKHWWRNRINNRINKPFQQQIYPTYSDAIQVMKEDWDNLIILDGCRADVFEEVVSIDQFDDYRRVKSLGGATGEWSSRNFADGEYGDTVYINGNPNPSRLAGDSFHHMEEVWRYSFDDEKLTVLPKDIITESKHALTEYPNKRFIIHFMQPHRPFLNTEDLQFSSWAPDIEDGKIKGTTQGSTDHDGPDKPWDALEHGLVDKETLWEAYRRNLEFVYEKAGKFWEELSGKTVITSDHGNLVGERDFPVPVRQFGHSGGSRHPNLITVPWAIYNKGNRREIKKEEMNSESQATKSELKQRLQDLGYV